MQEMVARRDLGDHAAIRLVFPLRGNFAYQQMVAAQNRDGCLVAGRFNREDGCHLLSSQRYVLREFSDAQKRVPTPDRILVLLAP